MKEEEEDTVKIELLGSDGSVYGTVTTDPVSSETAATVRTITTYDLNGDEMKSEVAKEEERIKVEDTSKCQADNEITVATIDQCVVLKMEKIPEMVDDERENECGMVPEQCDGTAVKPKILVSET